MKYKNFLVNISNNEITLLSQINKEFFINNSGKSNYFSLVNFESQYFYEFITNLEFNSLYNVIPMISIKGHPNDPYIVLSNSMLVTRYSNHRTIQYYLYSKYLQTLKDFRMDNLEQYLVIFKYKKIQVDKHQINNKFK